MISTAIWITNDEARIFTFKVQGVETKRLHRHGPAHAPEVHGRNHPKSSSDAERFFHEVALVLGEEGGDRWLLLGPGLAKNHFKSHVERHHAALAGHIVGLEAMDKATDGQIRDFAHEFFKRQGVFESA